MVFYLGHPLAAGGRLKSNGTLESGDGLWESPNVGATNLSGFSAIPGGRRDSYSIFLSLGFYSFMWTTTDVKTGNTRNFNLFYDSSTIGEHLTDKLEGQSVRCVKD